jgi:hypothetical protein
LGGRGAVRYYQRTTEAKVPPRETTWSRLTNLPGRIPRTVGNPFGWRTGLEYGFKQAKDELGGAA